MRHEDTKKILSLADQQQGYSRSPDAVYDPPPPVMKVLELTVPFCACRSPKVEEVLVTEPEMSSLLPDKDSGVGSS